jgi:GAF domain-containing protein
MSDQAGDWSADGRAALVANNLVSLLDKLVNGFDLEELLDRLVADCVSVLEIDAASILLLDRDRSPEVVASSDEESRRIAHIQVDLRTGPCIDSIRTGHPIAVTDAAEFLDTWPQLADTVQEVGYSAAYALPMRLRAITIGTLNLFGSTQPPLSGADWRLAQALADVATIGVLQRSLARSSELTHQLQRALNTRVVIEQAKGVVSEYAGIDMGAAFEALRKYAREHQVRLSTVAQSVARRDLAPSAVTESRESS